MPFKAVKLPSNYKQATVEELEKFMDETALPAWDRERVRVSDIRKARAVVQHPCQGRLQRLLREG